MDLFTLISWITAAIVLLFLTIIHAKNRHRIDVEAQAEFREFDWYTPPEGAKLNENYVRIVKRGKHGLYSVYRPIKN